MIDKLIGSPFDSAVQYLDETLDIANIEDWPNAHNGLQVGNQGRITKIGAAVDAGEATLWKAVEAGVDFLIVHHGLYWGGLQRLTGPFYRKVALAIRAELAVYSAHLPLDVHPTLGNNILLARALGLSPLEHFFREKGRDIGYRAEVSMTITELVERLEETLGGPVRVIRGGLEEINCVGLVTGGAGGEVARAAAEGVDTFVTGEAPHHAALAAEEHGVNLVLAGHYATETFGVKALAAHLAERLGLEWVFIDHPTGL